MIADRAGPGGGPTPAFCHRANREVDDAPGDDKDGERHERVEQPRDEEYADESRRGFPAQFEKQRNVRRPVG